MKRKVQIAFAIVLLVLSPWIVSLVRCEVLTAKYADNEVVAACESNNMIGKIDTLKVLERKPLFLKVYVRNGQGGHVMLLEKEMDTDRERWKVGQWQTIWAKHGSADGFVWPYIR